MGVGRDGCPMKYMAMPAAGQQNKDFPGAAGDAGLRCRQWSGYGGEGRQPDRGRRGSRRTGR